MLARRFFLSVILLLLLFNELLSLVHSCHCWSDTETVQDVHSHGLCDCDTVKIGPSYGLNDAETVYTGLLSSLTV